MNGNESTADRVIRVIAGIILLALGVTGTVAAGWGIVFDVVGGILLITGIVGICPLYKLLKFSTKKA